MEKRHHSGPLTISSLAGHPKSSFKIEFCLGPGEQLNMMFKVRKKITSRQSGSDLDSLFKCHIFLQVENAVKLINFTQPNPAPPQDAQLNFIDWLTSSYIFEYVKSIRFSGTYNREA